MSVKTSRPRRLSSLPELVRILPPQQLIYLWLAIFCTFATFSSSCAECLPGDLFALLTDGLIEVFNGKRDELGFDWAKGVLQSSDGQPLSAIADRLLSDARAFGAQLDDQTVLLIRRVNT